MHQFASHPFIYYTLLNVKTLSTWRSLLCTMFQIGNTSSMNHSFSAISVTLRFLSLSESD